MKSAHRPLHPTSLLFRSLSWIATFSNPYQFQVSFSPFTVCITRSTKDAASRNLTAGWAGDYNRCSAAMPTSDYFGQEAADLRDERHIQ